jgi:hypothetical protein
VTEAQKREYQRQYRERNKERLKQQKKEWWAANKEVQKEKKKEYYQENKEKIKAKAKKYYDENKPKARLSQQRYQEENREAIKAYQKRYHEENAVSIRMQRKEYYAANAVKIKNAVKRYALENKERVRESRRRRYEETREVCLAKACAYRRSNRDRLRVYFREYLRQRRRHDPAFCLASRLRCLVRQSVKGRRGYFKAAATFELVGCSPQFLAQHIESLFQPGMSWERFDEIHIDHIRPIASFDLSDPEQQRQCFHYTNLQPLWAKDNMSKGAKWEGDNEE